MSKQAQLLKGIRVVDYSHFLAGPYVSRCLAALGAEVIKVERPKVGDAGRSHPYFIEGQSGYFLQQNMGKKGLCVDVKDPRGLELMKKLVRESDVLVENYRPGTLKKLGLGYEELSAENPGLVYCSVSAFGQTGVDSDRAGFGLIAEAKSGAMDLIGHPGEMPPLFRMPVADMYAGAHGVAAVCAALLGRHGTGRGQHIDIALYDCMLSMHDFAAQFHTLSGGKEVVKRSGHYLPQSTVYGVFPAKDGCLVIAAQVDDSWKRLARLIGGEALAEDRRFSHAASRNAHGSEAIALVKSWTEVRNLEDCLAALDQAGVPCARVQSIAQALADPHIKSRGMLLEQHHSQLGPITMLNVPFNFSDVEPHAMDVAPLLGQHNSEIAFDLGYSDTEISAMQRDGVLYSEPYEADTSVKA
ncbi:CaiB/BaiF CoA transferase family protein [Janthinobacterium lividum]|uniref:CaiB/BaiF CoA transferase family protein n=1 Tax=Janthinobacterium lividum TaxID=29581 RepID=UPI000874AD74|nr:CoA transferase [Janthinobacterium lividum]MCC7716678.1 CoA transferase [Janthinobacterium lividum]OEZ51805.1 succinyl-CoA:(R)-benzylsuccinate CoA-transferase subunit BbsF [Janthinobacterium lividum]WQE31748.1 CoA transferase [Janthinobacterium lividum]STS86019.1 Formyl-coenzyme A transferase [Janthinobacterium lividum]